MRLAPLSAHGLPIPNETVFGRSDAVFAGTVCTLPEVESIQYKMETPANAATGAGLRAGEGSAAAARGGGPRTCEGARGGTGAAQRVALRGLFPRALPPINTLLS